MTVTARPGNARWRHGVRAAVTLFLPGLMIAGLAVGSLHAAFPSASANGQQAWYPLAPGTTSVFDTTADGKPTGQHVSVVTGHAYLTSLPGAPTGLVVTDHYDNFRGQGSALDLLDYAGWQGTNLLGYGFRVGGTFYQWTPADPELELPLRVGQSWKWKGKVGGGTLTVTYRLVGYRSVHALGRELTHCALYRSTSISIASNGSAQRTLSEDWFCFGLGPVRTRDVTGGHVYEETLVRFAGTSRTIAAPGSSPAVSPAPSPATPGTGPGIDQQRSNAVPAAAAPSARPAWTVDLSAPSNLVPVGNATLTIIGDGNGTIFAIDRRRGQIRWRATLPGPLPVAPVLAGSTLVVSDAAKQLVALDLRSGAELWAVTLPDLVAVAPAVSGATVVAVGEDQVVRAFRLKDGHQLWDAVLSSLASAGPAVAAGNVVVGEQDGKVLALSLGNGSVRWERTVQGPLDAGPDAGGGLVVVSDDDGAVYGFGAASGKLRWDRYVGAAVDFAPAVTAGRVVVVSGDSKLIALSSGDGSTLWSRTLPGALATGPVVLGDDVLGLRPDGVISQVSLASGRGEGEITLPTLGQDARATADRPLTYFGGDLVATLSSDLPYAATNLIALPPAKGAGRPPQGVAFTETPRPISPLARPTEAPVAVGGRLFFPGWDGKAWELPPEGRPVAVATTGTSFFAVPAGSLLLVQEGKDLAALDRASGAVRWRYPVGAPSELASPAVTRRLVVMPVQGKGLLALDRTTGRRQWFFPAAGALPSPPLALPGGDVVWAAPQGLVRLYGRTGRPVWSTAGVWSLAPLAERAGVVLVTGTDNGVERALAVNSRTGRVDWMTPPQALSLSIGPVIDGGVVLVAGNVDLEAFQLTTGRPLWSVPVATQLDGRPVVSGQRVVFAQKGPGEDLDSQGHTITTVGLRSGRFLGLLQLPGAADASPFALTFGAAGADQVTTYASGYIYVVGLDR